MSDEAELDINVDQMIDPTKNVFAECLPVIAELNNVIDSREKHLNSYNEIIITKMFHEFNLSENPEAAIQKYLPYHRKTYNMSPETYLESILEEYKHNPWAKALAKECTRMDKFFTKSSIMACFKKFLTEIEKAKSDNEDQVSQERLTSETEGIEHTRKLYIAETLLDTFAKLYESEVKEHKLMCDIQKTNIEIVQSQLDKMRDMIMARYREVAEANMMLVIENNTKKDDVVIKLKAKIEELEDLNDKLKQEIGKIRDNNKSVNKRLEDEIQKNKVLEEQQKDLNNMSLEIIDLKDQVRAKNELKTKLYDLRLEMAAKDQRINELESQLKLKPTVFRSICKNTAPEKKMKVISTATSDNVVCENFKKVEGLFAALFELEEVKKVAENPDFVEKCLRFPQNKHAGNGVIHTTQLPSTSTPLTSQPGKQNETIMHRQVSPSKWKNVHRKPQGLVEIDDDSCIICYEKLSTNSVKCDTCYRRFDKDCLAEWQKKNAICPVCNAPFPNIDSFPTLH
ncbi:unnamed protein product [Caenorhabditis bovis]|uniref:RING-type domain-containing protein n=1 Tax=Caenorhabditis bovis TaxID=2654633 RepID=A0A8S1ERW7_9PELO|nr:unnamed protein product [Caenorhabditis bovis]